MPESDRENASEIGGAYRAKLDAELQPTSPGKEVEWGIRLLTFDLRRKRVSVRSLPKLDSEDLSELGKAYAANLDTELRPTDANKEIDWGILLSTSEIRHSLARRAKLLSPLNRAAFTVLSTAVLLALIWLCGVGVDAFRR